MNMIATPHYTIQEAAESLGMGEHALFRELRRRRIIDTNNVPAPFYKENGRLIEKESTYKHPAIGVRFYSRTYVTQTGLDWLRDLLEKSDSDIARRDRLVAEIAAMNPSAGEIGAGKLAHIVAEARAILATNEATA